MSKNIILGKRLEALLKQLRSVHDGGVESTRSTKGREREIFIDHFLSGVMPPVYRFGFGDIIDESGNSSGQVDIVIENQFFPSVPMIGALSPRLYLAESVLVAIEVKSDISDEIGDAIKSANKIKGLKMVGNKVNATGSARVKDAIESEIPVFAVGYEGWKKPESILKTLKENPSLDGILVINPGIFVHSGKLFEGEQVYEGGSSLWGLISLIYEAGIYMLSPDYDIRGYLKD